jgi:hypothetical protein
VVGQIAVSVVGGVFLVMCVGLPLAMLAVTIGRPGRKDK